MDADRPDPPPQHHHYHGLDALRGVMMMLGIVLHASALYLAAPPGTWPVPADAETSPAFDLVFHFIHAFRMPAFFLLAGFFAALLVERRGMAGALKNRAARVLAPLVAGTLVILPVTAIAMVDFALSARFGTRALWPDPELLYKLRLDFAATGHPTGEPVALHLWFLLYLVWFCLLLPAWEALARGAARLDARLRGAPSRWIADPAFVFVPGMICAALLWPFRQGQVLEGFVLFRPHLPSLAYYGAFFGAGYLVRVFPAWLRTAAANTGVYGVMAAVLFPLGLYASLLEQAGMRGAKIHAAACIANGLATCALVAFLVGAAQRWFDRPSVRHAYAAHSAYWVYLVHLPLVFALGWLLLPFEWPAAAKFLLVVLGTALASFASYHWLVQGTWLGAFLNGRRYDVRLRQLL